MCDAHRATHTHRRNIHIAWAHENLPLFLPTKDMSILTLENTFHLHENMNRPNRLTHSGKWKVILKWNEILHLTIICWLFIGVYLWYRHQHWYHWFGPFYLLICLFICWSIVNLLGLISGVLQIDSVIYIYIYFLLDSLL